jgi:hypothetical protein
MNPDGVSLTCDDGAHERCHGCACSCHQYVAPSAGFTGGATPGVGGGAVPSGHPNATDVGSQTPHAHLDDL